MSLGLGRLPAPDARDAGFPMRAALPVAVTPPAYKYWYPGAILDQNGYPYCVGYAWKGWMLTSPTRTKDGPEGNYIYHEAQLVDEWSGEDYDGTSVRAGAKVLSAAGRVAEYRWAQTIWEVKEWILLKGPVVVGTNWYDDMFTPSSAGLVVPSGGVAGGHAYLVTGYSSYSKLFRCSNSWGYGWGQNGRFWLREADMARLLFSEDGEACAAVEKLP